MGKFIDLTDQRFGRLLVLRQVPNPKKPSCTGKIRTGAWWECHCECGALKSYTSENLRSGNSTSCGCLHREQLAENNRKLKAQEPWLADMLKYQRSLVFPSNNLRKRIIGSNGSVSKGLQPARAPREWSLTLDQYRNFVTSCCFYCGQEPNQKPLSKQMQALNMKRNGIDRVDNNLGYLPGNCVPCCAICNREKRSQSQTDFIAQTKRRYDHLVAKGLITT